MPHQRARYGSSVLRRFLRYWPVIGVLGARQVGKTTLVEKLLNLQNSVSFDDLELRNEAARSPKTFLTKYQIPLVVDEVQKVPEFFDAIKLRVDQKKIPGSYLLTGSTSFSSKIGIRESLTGRIGLMNLLPMTLGEIYQLKFSPMHFRNFQDHKPRVDIEKVVTTLLSGGMPVPAFTRDEKQRSLYWTSWLDTTLHRDLARLFQRNYDPDFAYALLQKIGSLLLAGELPTLKHFTFPARKVRTYFSAMEDIFLLKKISCHEAGIGKEVWLLLDSALALHLMKTHHGEGAMLTLARHFLWNEWMSQYEYQSKRLLRHYYKSAQGSPVDAVIEGIPFRVVPDVVSVTRHLKWEERPLLGAMKKLKSNVGYLVAPIEKPHLVKKGVGILPWSYWS